MKTKDSLQRFAFDVRTLLGAEVGGPIDLKTLVEAYGKLTIVYYPFADNISGMCLKSADLIAINSRSTLGRQNFSLAHELYHYFDRQNEDNSVSVAQNSKVKGIVSELEADLFASYLLMPSQSLHSDITERKEDRNKLELKDIIFIEQLYGVSRKSLLVRLVADGYLTVDESKNFEKDIQRGALRLGYDLALYKTCDKNIHSTTGRYLSLAHKLRDASLISQGKFESYLLDAFREDLVFDLEVNEVYD